MGKLSGTRARTHHKVSAVVMLLALVGLGLANAVALYVIEEFGNVGLFRRPPLAPLD